MTGREHEPKDDAFEDGTQWLAWKQEMQSAVPTSVVRSLQQTIRNFDPEDSLNHASVLSIGDLDDQCGRPFLASRFAIAASTVMAVAASVALMIAINRKQDPAMENPTLATLPEQRIEVSEGMERRLGSSPVLVSTKSPRFATQLPQEVQNASFEERYHLNVLRNREPVADWFVPNECRKAGYRFGLDSANAIDGDFCLKIEFVGSGQPYYGNIMQTLDAAAYRGKTVRLRAMLRAEVEEPDWQLHMWMREDLRNGKIGFFDNMEHRPIRSPEWQRAEISGLISLKAQAINVGIFLQGGGTAWVDDVHLEIVE